MFCANCGKENEDGVVFCSNCGKSPTRTNVVNQQNQGNGYPLINLSSRLFYPMFEFSLWVILIIGTVVGGVAGYFINSLIGSGGGTGAFLGVIIGFFISFIGVIHYAGKTSIMLKANEKKVHEKK